MANHASAEKRNRQRITRTARNRSVKSALRTELKKAHAVVDGGAVDGEAAKVVREAQSQLDVAAKKGVIPTKRASRLAGRLAAAQHKAQSSAAK
jgi:small subunit ribosomal protein S20